MNPAKLTESALFLFSLLLVYAVSSSSAQTPANIVEMCRRDLFSMFEESDADNFVEIIPTCGTNSLRIDFNTSYTTLQNTGYWAYYECVYEDGRVFTGGSRGIRQISLPEIVPLWEFSVEHPPGTRCTVYGCYQPNKFVLVIHPMSNGSCTYPCIHSTILEAPEQQVVLAGETATFRCRTCLALEIYWIHNGLRIDMAEAERNSKYTYSTSPPNELQTAVNMLQIQSTDSAKDIGSVICVAHLPNITESQAFLSVLGRVRNFRVEQGLEFTVSLPAPMEAELNLGIRYSHENGSSIDRISTDTYQNTTEITYIEENAPFSRSRVQFRLVFDGIQLGPLTLPSEIIDATTQGAIALGPEGFSLGIVKNVINGTATNIKIEGRNLDSVPPDDYVITVGGVSCDVVSVASSVIICTAPATLPNISTEVAIRVQVGEILDAPVNGMLRYLEARDNTAAIIAGVVPTVSVLLLVAIIVIAIIIFIRHVRARKTPDLTQAMTEM